MLDHGNGQLSAVGFFNPGLGEAPVGDFFGGAPGESHPKPYEVQWDGSLDGWKIYLPTGHLLSFNGEDVGTSSFIGVSPVPGSDDQAWKSLSEVGKNAGHAYLVLRVNKGTRAVEEARILPSAGSGSDSEEVYSFCIAELSYSSQLGFGEVRQSLVGALHVRGEGIPPDDISTEYYDGGSGQDGGSGSESETEKVLAVKGWHSMAATSGVTLAAEMGLVQQAQEGGEGDGESGGSAGGSESGSAGGSGSSRQVVVRNGVKGAIEYLDLGWFDVNGFVNSKIGDGVLSITVGNNSPVTFTANQATNASVTIPEGVALTDTDPSDVVLSTGTASAGVSTEAARADHVHKLPSTVKIKQSPVADPSASGTATAFIDSITQNANGEITVTKKNVDIPDAQVQSDWSVTDSTSKAFIKNKPTLNNLIATNGSSSTTLGKIVASQAATITIRSISAGRGINVALDGNTVVVSLADGVGESSGGSTQTGYTGTRTVLADIDYNASTHELRRRYISETLDDGRLIKQTLMPWEAYHQAVEEG